MFVLALIAILILGFISFRLLKIFPVFIGNQRDYSRHETETAPNEANPEQEDDKQLVTLIKKIDEYHKQNTKRSKGDRLEILMLVLWGFALTTSSLALAMISLPRTSWTISAIIVSVITAIGFSVLAIWATIRCRRYRPWDWRDFWGDKT